MNVTALSSDWNSPSDEVDRQIGCNPGILGDAEFRTVIVSGHEPEPDIAIIFQPVVIEVIAEPRAPDALHGHAAPDREDRERETGRGQRHKPQCLGPELGGVPCAR